MNDINRVINRIARKIVCDHYGDFSVVPKAFGDYYTLTLIDKVRSDAKKAQGREKEILSGRLKEWEKKYNWKWSKANPFPQQFANIFAKVFVKTLDAFTSYGRGTSWTEDLYDYVYEYMANWMKAEVGMVDLTKHSDKEMFNFVKKRLLLRANDFVKKRTNVEYLPSEVEDSESGKKVDIFDTGIVEQERAEELNKNKAYFYKSNKSLIDEIMTQKRFKKYDNFYQIPEGRDLEVFYNILKQKKVKERERVEQINPEREQMLMWWDDEISKKLMKKQQSFVKEMMPIFETNHPSSELAGNYTRYLTAVRNVKSLKQSVAKMLKSFASKNSKKFVDDYEETRKYARKVSWIPFFEKTGTKIVKTLNDINKVLKQGDKTKAKRLAVQVGKDIKDLNATDMNKARKKKAEAVWKVKYPQMVDTYRKVVEGKITSAKVVGKLAKICGNRPQANSIASALSEKIVQAAADSLKKWDEDRYGKVENFLDELKKSFTEMKGIYKASINEDEYMEPEDMVMMLRKKYLRALTADVGS